MDHMKEMVTTQHSENLREKAVKEIFDKLWETAAEDILSSVSIKQKNRLISAIVEATILSFI